MAIFSKVVIAGALVAAAPAIAVAAEMKAEVLHWWTSSSESAAIREFANSFKTGGGEWIDTAIAIGEQARAAGINRIVGGNPPTVMQFNTGKQFEELVSSGLLTELDSTAQANKWTEFLPKPIIKAITINGHVHAVPINIHAENWLWYNKSVLKQAGVEAPKTFGDILAIAPKLQAAGFIPLAHGAQNWQDHILFDAIVVAEAGKDVFRNLYGDYDPKATQTPGFRKAAEIFSQLRLLADKGSAGRNWNDTTNLVITGKAAMQVMGDWAKGDFLAAGQVPDKDFGCTVMPGGYVMGGDVFVFPKVKEAGQQAAQKKIAEIVLSPEGQIAFNKKKGSVPVRLDVDASSLDACAQTGMKELKDPEKQVVNRSYLTSQDKASAIRDVITQFWATKSMTVDDFITRVAAAMKSAT